VNASEPRKVAPAHSPTDTAPDAVGPSVARVGALGRHLDQWESKGHETVGIDWLRRHFALTAADAVTVAPDGHAALVERLREGLAASEHMRSVQKIDRTAQAFDRLRADNDALQVECDEAIEQAERHAEDVATAEREVSALRVTVAERDEVRGQLRAATSSLKRVRDVIEDDEMLNRFGHVNFDEDNDAAGARELQGIVAAALDGPDDRSGEAGLCSGSSTGVHLWIGRLAEDGPYRWCEWCKETRSLR